MNFQHSLTIESSVSVNDIATVCQHFVEFPLLRTLLTALVYTMPLWVHHRELRLFIGFHDIFSILLNLIFHDFDSMICYVVLDFHVGN